MEREILGKENIRDGFSDNEDGSPMFNINELLDYSESVRQLKMSVGKCPIDSNIDAQDCSETESCHLDREKRIKGVCKQCDYVCGW